MLQRTADRETCRLFILKITKTTNINAFFIASSDECFICNAYQKSHSEIQELQQSMTVLQAGGVTMVSRIRFPNGQNRQHGAVDLVANFAVALPIA